MPTLNLDIVTGRTLDVSKVVDGQEKTWQLRTDVPSSILVRTLYLLEIEQERPSLDEVDLTSVKHDAITALEAAMVRHEKYEEAEALEIVGAIWRWTDPTMTDEALAALLSPAERRSLVQAFFTLLLARFGKLPPSVTASSSQGDSPSTPTTPTATTQTPSAASSPTSTAPDSIPSATPSSEDSSSPVSSEASQTTETTEETSQETSQAA